MAVYFIRSGNYVKIGVADDPQRRLREHQTSSPQKLEMLGVLNGSYELERQLHNTFADFRVNGEWFELTTDILAVAQGEGSIQPPKEAAKRNREGDGTWVEYRPGPPRQKDGRRKYYPRLRGRDENGKKLCLGVPKHLKPLTEDEYREYLRKG